MVIWELERASSSIEMQMESSACPLQIWASLASYISILLQLNPVKLFFLTKFDMNKQAMRLIFRAPSFFLSLALSFSLVPNY